MRRNLKFYYVIAALIEVLRQFAISLTTFQAAARIIKRMNKESMQKFHPYKMQIVPDGLVIDKDSDRKAEFCEIKCFMS